MCHIGVPTLDVFGHYTFGPALVVTALYGTTVGLHPAVYVHVVHYVLVAVEGLIAAGPGTTKPPHTILLIDHRFGSVWGRAWGLCGDMPRGPGQLEGKQNILALQIYIPVWYVRVSVSSRALEAVASG